MKLTTAQRKALKMLAESPLSCGVGYGTYYSRIYDKGVRWATLSALVDAGLAEEDRLNVRWIVTITDEGRELLGEEV